MRSRFRSLRSQFVFPTIRIALARATRRWPDFRLAHFSVQADHLHLIVEAANKAALSRGIQGLAIRIARGINRLISRSGKLWADRFFSRALESPRAVRNALSYVLNNFRKHAPRGRRTRRGFIVDPRNVDPYSSAPYCGESLSPRAAPRSPPPNAERMTANVELAKVKTDATPILPPRTWLLCTGWRRARGEFSRFE